LDGEWIGLRMRAGFYGPQKFRECLGNSFSVGRVHDGGTAGVFQKCGGIARVRSERKDGLGQTEVFENLGGNLMVATGGLKKKETVGVSGVLQGLAIGQRRKEMHKVLDAFGAEGRSVVVAGRAQFDAQSRGVDCAPALQGAKSAKERERVAFDGIEETHMDEAERAMGNARSWDEIAEVLFVVAVANQAAAVGRKQGGITVEVHVDGRVGGEKDVSGVAHGRLFEPTAGLPGQRIAGIAGFGHGVAEIHNPRPSGQAMQQPSDENGGRDGKGGENGVALLLADEVEASRDGAQAPGDPLVGNGHQAEIASANGEVPLGAEGESAADGYRGGNLGQLRGVGLLVGAGGDGEHAGLPAELREVPAELERAKVTAAGSDGWEMIGNDENFAHVCRC
jgi:hypothetical protein